MTVTTQHANLAGIVVDLLAQDTTVTRIIDHALQAKKEPSPRPAALSVVSVNLDHIVQFGHGSCWHDTLGDSLHPTRSLSCLSETSNVPAMKWLNLLDGAPLVERVKQLSGQHWPRLAGSDLIGPLLDEAEHHGLRVGFLGGQPSIQADLAAQLAQNRTRLKVSGFWAPEREDIEDEERSLLLAEQIRESHTDILVVGLGKPRQELWMASYGSLTGASVLLAFGAVVDFLAGTVQRAPQQVSEHGLEWAWRLALEPRRLAQRYLVNDPPGLVSLQRRSTLIETESDADTAIDTRLLSEPSLPESQHQPSGDGRFITDREFADISVLAVTYNNAKSVDQLIDSLRVEAKDLRLRVIIADNQSTDTTVEQLRQHDDVIVVPTGSNLGYAGGINVARQQAGDCTAVLVLNPDLVVAPGSIRRLLQRMQHSDAGIVVPRLLETNGQTYTSLRREPSLLRATGDALFGERLSQRPGWSSEIEYNPESYAHPHCIDWATGAALLIESALERRLGAWDEQFFLYSEETDYFRRAREAGASIWYEPEAHMTHQMGGSGSSVRLEALMAVNRIRYARKHRSARAAAYFRSVVIGHEVLRSWKQERYGILQTLVNESSWNLLPAASDSQDDAQEFPCGTVIIPAHNEAAVIARTLEPLQPLARAGLVQVIVSCNGCTDDTAQIARGFEGIQVLESAISSKVAALNLADAHATEFPRLYLDADIKITASALRMVLEHLAKPGVLAARPAFAYDTAGASWLVKSFYRARRQIPNTNQALWGAGAYGLSNEGRNRFDEFPSVTADDLFIDQQFTPEEKTVLPSVPVQVKTPRSTQSLLAILRRNYRGQNELHRANQAADSTRSTVRQLLTSISGPLSAGDALVYASLVVLARATKRPRIASKGALWERDDSSRQSA